MNEQVARVQPLDDRRLQRILRSLFRLVWRKRFDPAHHWAQKAPRLIRVTGWRSCLWDAAGGQRQRVTFEPGWLTWVDRPEMRPWRTRK